MVDFYMQDFLLEDGTVKFLPNRLNRQPVIVRGLTADELWMAVSVAGVFGLVLGIVVAVLTGQIGMAPTTILISIAVGVFVGGGILRRKKRGRPETWLYRQAQWWITRRYSCLGALIGGKSLIHRSGWWEVKRALLPNQRRAPQKRPVSLGMFKENKQ